MPRVARLLVYEGPEEWLAETLARSIGEGTKTIAPDKRIHTVTLSSALVRLLGLLWGEAEVLMHTEEPHA